MTSMLEWLAFKGLVRSIIPFKLNTYGILSVSIIILWINDEAERRYSAKPSYMITTVYFSFSIFVKNKK